ncbi:MAG: homoserine O-acetyltransferase [Agarilytica sp.]
MNLYDRFSHANILLSAFLFSICLSAQSADLLTEKQRFVIKDFKTTSGVVLPEVQVGWESYGKLNANKDNVIVISHYLAGTSHAAGKYSPDDKRAGYWDYIIGPGKAVDTDKFFVISTDSLSNAQTKNPKVFTTGPFSIDPSTGRPYGTKFPVVTVRDFVNTQYALLKSLGVTKIHATMGASMGSHQSLEWANAYPDMVERVISVIGAGEANVWSKADIGRWANEIQNDPNWNNGDYYDGPYPIDGITRAMWGMLFSVYHGHFLDQKLKTSIDKDRGPWEDITAKFEVTTWLEKIAASRASVFDPNAILYLARSCQLWRLGHGDSLAEGIKPIKAKILLLPAKHDEILGSYMTKQFYNALLMQNKRVQYEEIVGPWGHMDGIYAIGTKTKEIEAFLNTD